MTHDNDWYWREGFLFRNDQRILNWNEWLASILNWLVETKRKREEITWDEAIVPLDPSWLTKHHFGLPTVQIESLYSALVGEYPPTSGPPAEPATSPAIAPVIANQILDQNQVQILSGEVLDDAIRHALRTAILGVDPKTPLNGKKHVLYAMNLLRERRIQAKSRRLKERVEDIADTEFRLIRRAPGHHFKK